MRLRKWVASGDLTVWHWRDADAVDETRTLCGAWVIKHPSPDDDATECPACHEIAERPADQPVEYCSECGLPLPAPHRGTCSMSLMRGGPGYGAPS